MILLRRRDMNSPGQKTLPQEGASGQGGSRCREQKKVEPQTFFAPMCLGILFLWILQPHKFVRSVQHGLCIPPEITHLHGNCINSQG